MTRAQRLNGGEHRRKAMTNVKTPPVTTFLWGSLILFRYSLQVPERYIKPMVMLEIGARSLFEPNKKSAIQSIIEGEFPTIQTSLVDAELATATPGKTFLEKVFLLHELFSIPGHGMNVNR